MNLDKGQLRRKLIQNRQLMPQTEWREKSSRICQHLLASPMFLDAKTVLAYFSFRQEPDLDSLIFNPSLNKVWGFPRCVGKDLYWHFWKPGDYVTIGRFGIREPTEKQRIIPSSAVDLILVPCVACDYQGYRLGYGGGYYDRLLTSGQWSAKPTIGIVFEEALLPQLPTDSWDKPLQAVCAEVGCQQLKTTGNRELFLN